MMHTWSDCDIVNDAHRSDRATGSGAHPSDSDVVQDAHLVGCGHVKLCTPVGQSHRKRCMITPVYAHQSDRAIRAKGASLYQFEGEASMRSPTLDPPCIKCAIVSSTSSTIPPFVPAQPVSVPRLLYRGSIYASTGDGVVLV
eukprot:3941007-Rhodomonas_salina.3